MARTKMYRKERGEWIAIATAVIYIREAGQWRETSKPEMDVLEIQNGLTTSNPPMTTSIDLPGTGHGEDGDYYALLYPLAWEGEVWSAETD